MSGAFIIESSPCKGGMDSKIPLGISISLYPWGTSISLYPCETRLSFKDMLVCHRYLRIHSTPYKAEKYEEKLSHDFNKTL